VSTLLLRLAGPMQAWGTQSRFEVRDTEREPTKSGVIGLLCAALGRARSEPIDDLVALSMAARVDSEGTVETDYHTAGTSGIRRASGSLREEAVLSRRYYLADADFLVGISGDEMLLRTIDEALDRPHWQLFLGRKSMPPSWPVRLPDSGPWGPGLRWTDLETAVKTFPRLPGQGRWVNRSAPLRVVIDDPAGTEIRRDVPVSFEARTFLTRSVTTMWVSPPFTPAREVMEVDRVPDAPHSESA